MDDANLYAPPTAVVARTVPRKRGMLRTFLFGIAWFIIFLIGGLIVGGAIVGGAAGANSAADASNPGTTFSEGYRRGSDAGRSILPGTKRRNAELTRDA